MSTAGAAEPNHCSVFLLIMLPEKSRRYKEAGLSAHFVFTRNHHDIPDLLAATDVVVSPSQVAEGFGPPLIEAMVASRPIAASNIGPIHEILGEGTELLVPPGDVDALSRALTILLDDPTLCQRMGAKGKERVARHFSMEQHTSKITEIYNDLIDRVEELFSYAPILSKSHPLIQTIVFTHGVSKHDT